MKISICLDALYSGKNPVEAMREVAALGVKAVEFWSWWDKDIGGIKSAKEELGLVVNAFCTKFASLADIAQRDGFLKGLEESIEAAKLLACKTLITQVGADTGAPRGVQEASIVGGLQACAPLLEKEGITLVFEPLNIAVDHAGYYLYSSDEAFRIADQVGSLNVKVLFDIYHQQITEGHLIQRITQNIGSIGHFHAAGNPGRHELYYGEINYPEVFKAIDRTGYGGYIGFEYTPADAPSKGILAFL